MINWVGSVLAVLILSAGAVVWTFEAMRPPAPAEGALATPLAEGVFKFCDSGHLVYGTRRGGLFVIPGGCK